MVRGTGKQAAAAPCTVASYYLLGLPAAALLAFPLNLGESYLLGLPAAVVLAFTLKLGESCCPNRLRVWFMLVCMVCWPSH